MTSEFRSAPGNAPLLTIEEAAALLKIGRTNTYGLVMAGQIQSVKIGRRRLVVASGLQVFIDRLIEEQG
jgi:excisionase family DNA binding protein